MDWNTFFFKMCDLAAEKSKDPSSKVGCVIIGPNNEVRSLGYNGLPRKVSDNLDLFPERSQRPKKYFYYEHAERNAIYNAARIGIPLAGCVLYVGGIPCADCARAIIQSGIVKVIVKDSNVPERWKDSCDASMVMFNESGVLVEKANIGGGCYGKE